MPDPRKTSRPVIEAADLSGATATALKGDLSSRRYFRLTDGRRSAILMELADGDTETLPRVLDVTRRLSACGSSVPAILATGAGAAVIEDFGDTHLADLLRGGTDPERLLSVAVEALDLARGADGAGLARPTADELAGWTDIIDDWLPGCDRHAASDLRAALADRLRQLDAAPAALSLRDAHVENVIWLPERTGARRAGLIDFQDALLMHPVYDLASLLRDARIDIDADLADRLLLRSAATMGLTPDAARYAFDVLSFQRNLRIAGIFHRSARRDGKAAHLSHLPRVLGHIRAAARNPGLGDLARILPRLAPAVAEAAPA